MNYTYIIIGKNKNLIMKNIKNYLMKCKTFEKV